MQNYRDFRETTAPPVPKPDGGSSGRRLAIAGAFTGILVMGMVLRDESVDTAIIGGAALFGVAYALEAISHSPLLIARTLARIDQQTQLALHPPPVRVVEPPQIPIAATLQAPALPEYPRNFVPAIEPPDRQTLRDAKTWLMELWLSDHHLDPNRVLPEGSKAPGKLQWALPANKAAIRYMLDVGLIEREKYGYRYVGPPTPFEAIAVLNNGGASHPGTLPYPAPHPTPQEGYNGQ